MRTALGSLLQLWLVAGVAANCASAGGGPENVLLLVNSNSLSSKTVANYYIGLRNVPASNVVYIDWRGGIEECQGQYFRSQILKPAIDAIHERKLAAQIDYVVYSSDFPWRVHLKPLFPDETFEAYSRPIASCTGATYLWHYVEAKHPAVVQPVTNWYLAPDEGENDVRCQKLGKVPSRGFRSSYFWDSAGQRTTDLTKGQNYLLSTMLGVTTGRGNTIEEIVAYLRRSVAADGTRPRGTVYFMKNNNIRSQTRHVCYDEAAQQLARLGVKARVVQGVVPQGADDVLGIMTGAENVDLAGSRSTMLPGAICDNLTSLGGVLQVRAGQTPLTDFLRRGASGASGTVFEPLALQAKFALPSLFLHYARGCSLAESYYQSVAAPYQLLIVGDPLCQPWAVKPTVTLDGVAEDQEVKGKLTIDPTASAAAGHRVGRFELFVDGRLVALFSPGRSLALDTSKLPDGYHELRVVAVDADAIETRGHVVLPVRVNNHGATVELSATPRSDLAATDHVRISARQPGATAIVVRQNRREIARFEGESGEVELLAATFGRGPVALQAESEGPQPAVSPPLRLNVH